MCDPSIRDQIIDVLAPHSLGCQDVDCTMCGSAETRADQLIAFYTPAVEDIAETVHDGWMAVQRARGVTSRRSPDGEEQMVPYAALSESAKDVDRAAAWTAVVGLLRCDLLKMPAEVLW
jgi:hypothetical protein